MEFIGGKIHKKPIMSDSIHILVILIYLQETSCLGWANLQLFDFNNRLLNEKYSLYLWPLPQGMDELLNYVGLPGKNKVYKIYARKIQSTSYLCS